MRRENAKARLASQNFRKTGFSIKVLQFGQQLLAALKPVGIDLGFGETVRGGYLQAIKNN